MPIEVEHFDNLDAVARDAEGALDRALQPRLFDRLGWFALLDAHCRLEGAPFVLRAREGSQQAWLFLARRGQHAEAFASWYSLAFGAIGAPGHAMALARAARRARLASITLAPLEAADPLPAAFRAAGWATIVEPANSRWQVATEGCSFDDYWASRGSQLRNTVKRKAKTAALDIMIYRDFDEQAWMQYGSVYAASWKPEEGSMPFWRALAEQEGQAGTLRLGIAAKDGKPIAAQLWLVENGRATIHKLAYAETARPLSAGSILSAAMFRHVIDEDRVGSIDFGLGDDAYKADWMDERIELLRLRAFNLRRPSGLYRYARARLSALVRRRRSG